MEPAVTEARPPLTTYEALAKMIDHSLVRPELTDDQVIEGCALAKCYQVATVSVRPCDVDMAVRLLDGSGVIVGSISGFPHGSTTTAAKLYETRDLLRRGAKEIDMVINIGKLISRHFDYVEMELTQMAEACHENGALLKVIFENGYLTDELKIIACQISTRAGVDFLKTSSAFAPTGYTLEGLRLMRKHAPARISIKAASGVRTLQTALEVYGVGCSRFGATRTAEILEAWKVHLSQTPQTA
jgi:deoxyribose-phosphate aldolase